MVAGINIKVRHIKPKAEGESGQITERESPIHHSNVMLYSKENKTRSRIGFRWVSRSADWRRLLCFLIFDISRTCRKAYHLVGCECVWPHAVLC